MDTVATDFLDDFRGPGLDPRTWVASYLPMWSSRAESAAVWSVADGRLRLELPPDHPVWCEGDHLPATRVSGIQSGVWSGPVGSTLGQQPFRPGQLVREAQTELRGWTPSAGLLEIRCAMGLSPRSMAAAWLVGLEDEPERCGEVCLVEVFGDALGVDSPSAAVGQGVHPFRDPRLHDDFVATPLPLDVTTMHTYAAHWRPPQRDDPGRGDFLVDGEVVRTVPEAPAYPLQIMVAVFDFPEHALAPEHVDHVPWLEVEHVRGGTLPG